jgi:hypothetical protein
MLKRILASVLCVAFSAVIVGCEASAKVGDPNDTSSTTTVRDSRGADTYKKTTTVQEPNGDVHTKTETRIDR